MTTGLNRKTYIELVQAFPPRPIKSEAEMLATQKVIDSLIDHAPPFDQAQGTRNDDEEDYLHVLGTLVYEYEQTLEPIPDIHGVELLKVLIEDNELLQKDLVPIFKTESIVSDILNQKRQLTTRHIKELAKFFNVSPAAFLPD